MNKKQRIDKETILVVLLLIIAVSTFAFYIKIDSNDELWNFSNIYKMVNGKTIYKDTNVIITPLFFYIGKMVLQIFGSNYLVFRIYNVAIWMMFYILIYKIYTELKIEKNRKILYLIITYILTYRMIVTGANYNILAMNFCLLGILWRLSQKKEWTQGIIIFLIFMAKQNIGVYYAIGYCIYHLLKHRKLKETIKQIMPTFMITFIGISVYLIYLFLTQNLYHFINYAFLGISEFNMQNFMYDQSIYMLIMAISSYIFILWVMLSKKVIIDKQVKEQALIIISLSLPSLLIAYPLFNGYHIRLAIVPTILVFIYLIEKTFLEELASHKKMITMIKIINGLSIILVSLLCIYLNTNYFLKMKNDVGYHVYDGALMDEQIKNNINEIINYITKTEEQGHQVKILSYKSNLYMNILKRNNKNIDLPFHGNLGIKGEDGLIEEIKDLKNTNLLILKQEDNLYQESKKVREYVMDHYEKIGEIEEFIIYKVGY